MTKQYNILKTLLLAALLAFVHTGYSQAVIDSAGKRIETTGKADDKADSVMLAHSPRTASIRSAIIPGWGQAYNKKYWKIPIVYGALGTSGYIFYYNITWYRRFRYAYKVLSTRDSANFVNVHPKLDFYIKGNRTADLKTNRDEFRRNVDYSVLVFALFWGLNVVDAAVDAHMKTFDVSPDLALKFKPGYSQFANTNGVSLVLTFK